MKLFYTVVFSALLSYCSAQNIEFSPLSRFGFGDMTQNNNASLLFLGKKSTAFASEEIMNMDNPASLGFLKLTDAEIGIHAKYKNIKFQNGSSAKDWSGNLSYIGIGIPFRNTINEILDRKTYNYAFGMNVILKPLTSSGYDFVLRDSTEQFGRISRELNARGGLNQLSTGFGYRKKNLGFGIDFNYIFGTQRYDQFLSFDDIIAADNPFLQDKYSTRGFAIGIGTIYKKILNNADIKKENTTKEKFIQSGIKVQLPSQLNIYYNALHLTKSSIGSSVDTVLNIVDQKENGKIPLMISAGLYYEDKEKYGLSVDHTMQMWEQAKLHSSQKGSLKNVNQIGIGVWYKPTTNTYGGLFKRAKYSLAANYANDYRNIKGINPSSYAIITGISFPFTFQRQSTMVHLGIEYGQFNYSTVINDHYIKLNLGFTINDNEWFLRRRYD